MMNLFFFVRAGGTGAGTAVTLGDASSLAGGPRWIYFDALDDDIGSASSFAIIVGIVATDVDPFLLVDDVAFCMDVEESCKAHNHMQNEMEKIPWRIGYHKNYCFF
ncbi:hypothetical protein NECAME_14449 [Necator americanus]|uniref:Uncharacterized protein n=1 Tax=Necator americanus TaxID=51031 RepID=W2SMS5_NECAM|nr:hypothetical protein NECAME_14449 [Necator americanus]ETN70945.1 hypothetical protein NECAME_14449 [Necator americanus]